MKNKPPIAESFKDDKIYISPCPKGWSAMRNGIAEFGKTKKKAIKNLEETEMFIRIGKNK